MGQTALPIKRTNFSHHYLRVLTQKTKSSEHFHVRSLVGEGGFEPPKSVTTDLQSAPFGHSGIPPYSVLPSSSFTNPRRKPAKRLRSEKEKGASGYGAFRASGKRNGANAFRRGAGRRTRTPDLLITNQLLYQLSYTSTARTSMCIISVYDRFVKCFLKLFLFFFKQEILFFFAVSFLTNGNKCVILNRQIRRDVRVV